MRRRLASFLVVAFMFFDQARIAGAGMPSVTLSDVARMRVQTISFFLLCFLVCAWVVQRIWNSLRADFPKMPRLSYRKALGVVALWGMLFLLVLTMISGARELMTPGAWKKDGFTYKLAQDQTVDRLVEERRQALDRLRIALWTYARGHEGQFPATDALAQIPDDAWRAPDPSGMRYVYVAGRVADAGHAILAYEPGIFGNDRFVLTTDGRISRMNAEEIRLNLASGKTP